MMPGQKDQLLIGGFFKIIFLELFLSLSASPLVKSQVSETQAGVTWQFSPPRGGARGRLGFGGSKLVGADVAFYHHHHHPRRSWKGLCGNLASPLQH